MAQLAHLSDVVRPSHQGRVGVPPGEDHLPRRTVQAGDHLFQWEQAGVHRSTDLVQHQQSAVRLCPQCPGLLRQGQIADLLRLPLLRGELKGEFHPLRQGEQGDLRQHGQGITLAAVRPL